ncbi:MAG: RsmE family RNA methyltransferase [Planctomycetota bacterium]
MSVPWFHLPELPEVGAVATLDRREAQHATAARRLAAGSRVEVFDGRGTVAEARIIASDETRRGAVALEITSRRVVPPPAPLVHLACALPKGDRQSTLLSMATQLGIASFTPLECERSVARPGPSFDERAMRICLEACKQSRRAHAPDIAPAATPLRAAEAAAARGDAVLAAHPDATPLREALTPVGTCRGLTAIVGPEGGLTDVELDGLRAAGVTMLALGEAILRIETAAVALLAVLVLSPRGSSPLPDRGERHL